MFMFMPAFSIYNKPRTPSTLTSPSSSLSDLFSIDMEATSQSMIKGKRTKRQRPLSLLSLAMPNSTLTSSDHNLHRLPLPSPSSGFTDISSCTEEEEEEENMAHCLILLARGRSGTTQKPESVSETPRFGNFKVVGSQSGLKSPVSENPRIGDFKVVGSQSELGSPVSETPRFGDFNAVGTQSELGSPVSENPRIGDSGLSAYRCKTCDRSFPSFQALGGHRASHTIRPKPVAPVTGTEQNRASKQSPPAATATTLTLQIPKRVGDPTKSKVHECMVCGVEFSSGQALGGHMRRHRTLLAPTTTIATTATSSTSLDTAGDVFDPEFPPEAKKQRRTHLDLDLNLPAAPEEDRREPEFRSFGGFLPLLII